MIRYALACAKGHAFESWFQNSAAYDKQAKRGLVTCPVCGDAKVEKAIMAPRLAGHEEARQRAAPPPRRRRRRRDRRRAAPRRQGAGRHDVAAGARVPPEARASCASISPRTPTMSGQKFPEEARKMHYGEIEHRSIYGEASPQDAKELHEEGIEFHPLPVLPDERN